MSSLRSTGEPVLDWMVSARRQQREIAEAQQRLALVRPRDAVKPDLKRRR